MRSRRMFIDRLMPAPFSALRLLSSIRSRRFPVDWRGESFHLCSYLP
jgi:hypothetical protein